MIKFIVKRFIFFLQVFFLTQTSLLFAGEQYPAPYISYYEIGVMTKLAYFEDYRVCKDITANLLARWYKGYAATITEIITAPAQYHVYVVPDGYEGSYGLPGTDNCVFRETWDNATCVITSEKHLTEYVDYYRGNQLVTVTDIIRSQYNSCYEGVIAAISSTPYEGCLNFAARNGTTYFKNCIAIPGGLNLIEPAPQPVQVTPVVTEQIVVPPVVQNEAATTIPPVEENNPTPYPNDGNTVVQENLPSVETGTAESGEISSVCSGDFQDENGNVINTTWTCNDSTYPYCPLNGMLAFTCHNNEAALETGNVQILWTEMCISDRSLKGHENYYYIPAICREGSSEGGLCGEITAESGEPVYIGFIFLLISLILCRNFKLTRI